MKLPETMQNHYETKEQFYARENKKGYEYQLPYEVLLERKIIRDNFFKKELNNDNSICKVISEDALIVHQINAKRLMVSNNNLVIPLKYLNIIKSSIIYAKILLHEYIYNEVFNLEDESIEQYKQAKLRIQQISETLQKLNHSFIMHFEGVDDIMLILGVASDCLMSAYYEDTMGLDFYDLYFEKVRKSSIKKKFNEVMGLLIKINNFYNFMNLKNTRITLD